MSGIDPEKAAANRRAREERKKAHLQGIFDRYAGQFRAAAGRDAPSVAREAHGAMGALLQRDLKAQAAAAAIRCGKGCAHCCHGPVEIWPQEAALLVGLARRAGVAIDRERLERQSRHAADTWRGQPAEDRRCVFLGGDGGCRVYESRPNACRKLLVLSDPALCDADRHPPEAVARWMSWEAEIMESAALDVYGAVLMPRALLAELDR